MKIKGIDTKRIRTKASALSDPNKGEDWAKKKKERGSEFEDMRGGGFLLLRKMRARQFAMLVRPSSYLQQRERSGSRSRWTLLSAGASLRLHYTYTSMCMNQYMSLIRICCLSFVGGRTTYCKYTIWLVFNVDTRLSLSLLLPPLPFPLCCHCERVYAN